MVSNLVLIYFGRPRLGHTIKTNLITFQILDPEICSILRSYKRVWDQLLHQFFLYSFSRKVFLILYSINWPNFISWLPLLLEILDSICIVNIFCSACNTIHFEINLRFFIKPLFSTRKSWQKCKYLKNEQSF